MRGGGETENEQASGGRKVEGHLLGDEALSTLATACQMMEVKKVSVKATAVAPSLPKPPPSFFPLVSAV